MEYFQKFLDAPVEFLWGYGLPFVLVLSVLVFVHEWGHYIVARMCGVRVEKFSIGFGKEIFGRTDRHGTRWKFSWLPLGGYVQMFGDVDPASARHEEGVKEGEEQRPFTEEERKVAFYTQPVGKRAAIVFAGPAINYIFAVIILTGLYAVMGQPFTPPVVASIREGFPAEKAGIMPDDRIVEVDGTKIERWEQMSPIISMSMDKEIEIKLVRYLGDSKWSDEVITMRMTPETVEMEDRFGFKSSRGLIGITAPKMEEMREHTPLTAFTASLHEVWKLSVDTLHAIWQMITGTRSTDELGGILRIGAYAGEFAKAGVVSLVTFAALLSVNLGLLNLLPIPMLDGGHLAMYAMERVRGKPLSERVQEYVLRVGFTFLLGMMVFATWNDLVQLKVIDYVVSLVS